MSIFSSRTIKTLDIPFDEPHTVTIQKLSGRHLGKARDAYVAELYSGIAKRGGAAVQKDMQLLMGDDKAKTDDAIEKVKKDPLGGLDKFTLVKFGVKGWSYDDRAVDDEAIDDLDDDALEFFAREVMRLTKPALFLDEPAAEAARKND